MALKLSGFKLASKVRIVLEELKILSFGLLFGEDFVLVSYSFEELVLLLLVLLVELLFEFGASQDVVTA